MSVQNLGKIIREKTLQQGDFLAEESESSSGGDAEIKKSLFIIFTYVKQLDKKLDKILEELDKRK